jgi:hypothetical protein
MSTRLTWAGSLQAQQEADLAYRRLWPKRKRTRSKAVRSSKPGQRGGKKVRGGGSYLRYLAGKKWKAKRQEALNHYGHACTICGSKHGLQVHHLQYTMLGHEPMTHLNVLCAGCHGLEHEDKYPSQDVLSKQFRATI